MIRKTIIVILWVAVAAFFVMLFLPFLSGIPRCTDCNRAENTAYNLKNAISAYFTEYRQYPGMRNEGPDLDLDSGHVLILVWSAGRWKFRHLEGQRQNWRYPASTKSPMATQPKYRVPFASISRQDS